MNCTLLGNGGWGTALAMVLHANGHDVTVWGPFEEELNDIVATGENKPYLPGVPLPHAIRWTTDPAAVRGAGLVVIVVPSRYVRSTLEQAGPFIPDDAVVVSATKGLDEKTHRRISEITGSILQRDIAVLSGPSHAEEVARGVPTAVTVAGHGAEYVQHAFTGNAFRVYTSEDVVGVELGGALKNIIAVAAGILDGMGGGDNAKAALMTRGLAEITRLGVALGARPETFAGLSGIGDLIVTCASRHSRNRTVGERLGRGEPLQKILGEMKQVAEGIWNAGAARDLARDLGIDMPITGEVCAVVETGKDPLQALADLMSRDPKPESPPAHRDNSGG